MPILLTRPLPHVVQVTIENLPRYDAMTRASADFVEGVTAFREKREPRY